MDWLEVHVDTLHDGLESVEATLSTLGIDNVVIDDETEFQDFLENNHQCWDYVDEELAQKMHGRSRITFYLETGEAGFSKLAEVRVALSELKKTCSDCGTLLVTLDTLADADWENNWKQYYKPMEIGQRLLVVPQWMQADEEVLMEEGRRISLVLDPGLTFGTGSHATTRLCLTALEQHIHGGEQVLDLGCGSGILSIAALRLGAAHATAVDIDDKCLHVAYENAALNDIEQDSYTVLVGDILTDTALQAQIGKGGYHMVVANIVADVIIGLAPAVRPLLAEGGLFLCSGIIDDRAEEVAQALRGAGLEIVETHSSEGWFAYLCR